MIEEKCEACKHLGEIYVPPTKDREPFYMDACFRFAESDKRVMYLDTTESLCECFKLKESED